MPRIEKIVFFGTPDFAVPTLAALGEAGLAPCLVVSQPDRPAGRGQTLTAPPVARFAREHGLPLRQVERVRDPAFLADLAELAPDLAIVVAFGQIFPQALLDLPRLGCVNLHASLLPRWRGAAPIQAAIGAGDERTGVSTMQMEAGLDSGPILLQREVAIGPEETAGELFVRLADLGAAVMVETVRALGAGELAPRPQPADGVTFAGKLKREQGRVDWTRPAEELARLLRAATPWPGLAAELDAAPVRLVAARALAERAPSRAAAGEVLGLRGDALAVAAGDGSVLALDRVQRPGRRAVLGREFANGERLEPGARFQ